MAKLKTYRVAFAESHSQYYEVRAQDEDQAFDRAIAYDEDKSWALGTWDEGVNDQSHADTEEVDD